MKYFEYGKENEYPVVLAVYDGFNPGQEIFRNNTKGCEGKENGTCCSLGGSFVGLLVQRKKIHIDHGILGSSDLEKSGVLAAKKLFGVGSDRMAFVKKESVRNQFYSDLITPLENGISVSGTTVHCFYAVKMGEEYEKRYR